MENKLITMKNEFIKRKKVERNIRKVASTGTKLIVAIGGAIAAIGELLGSSKGR